MEGVRPAAFSHCLVRHSDASGSSNLWVIRSFILNFFGINVESSTDIHFFAPAGDMIKSVVNLPGQVARIEPAVTAESCPRFFRHPRFLETPLLFSNLLLLDIADCLDVADLCQEIVVSKHLEPVCFRRTDGTDRAG